MIQAIQRELLLQKNYLSEKINTIYFGGGTPSIMKTDDIQSILETIYKNFDGSSVSEITLEANPDDMDRKKIQELKYTVVNRISLGVQSFFDEDLKYLNRSHHAAQADYAVKALQDGGYTNISIDLIYGIPTLELNRWKQNLATAVQLGIPHISAYALTVEPKTNLEFFIRKEKLQEVSEEDVAEQYSYAMKFLKEREYTHYEISNFALPGMESKHNRLYWEGAKYLGAGPSAHSYDGSSRQWNCCNTEKYIEGIKNRNIPCEKETLTKNQKYNEYIMTSLRIAKGVDMLFLQQNFGDDFLKSFTGLMQPHLDKGFALKSGHNVVLTNEGKLFADRIAADFFII